MLRAFLLALAVRSLTLALPHTFFQPDEFYQAFEPAYKAVFGHGYLTWEWRDLAAPHAGGWWDELVVGGRLRGWLWPGVFAVVYKIVQALGLESTEVIVIAPRIVGVLVAAATDYYTYRLASKVLGHGYATGALFLSLTSLFNAHLLPRALSTSPETLLTVMALCYYPLPSPKYGADQGVAAGIETSKKDVKGRGVQVTMGHMDRIENRDVAERPVSSTLLASALAALSICIRPTMAVFWAHMHLEITLRLWLTAGTGAAMAHNLKTLVGGLSVVAASTALDTYMFGRLTMPLLTFFHHNVTLNLSAFYGSTGIFYHLTQSLPILLVPVWYWVGQGLMACFTPSGLGLDVPAPLRALARVSMSTIAFLSLSPHSEWRFLHPLLPIFLLFALPALQREYTPTMLGDHKRPSLAAARQYCRMPYWPFYSLILVPILPWVYLNAFHGAAQVGVMNSLRRREYGPVQSVVALMPCHSTPWASHLGPVADKGWFLTCEPPLGIQDRSVYRTEQDKFYAAPGSYIADVFPARLQTFAPVSKSLPSHVILFGELLDRAQGGITVRHALEARGYAERAALWNGFDIAQDDEKRRGGVRVWTL